MKSDSDDYLLSAELKEICPFLVVPPVEMPFQPSPKFGCKAKSLHYSVAPVLHSGRLQLYLQTLD